MCGGGWGLQTHIRVQPNNCAEVVLCCVVVGFVTTDCLTGICVSPSLVE